MSDHKITISMENLGRALDRLSEALAEKEPSSLVVDATIQRFEFSMELFWKTLRRLLAAEGEGVEASTPRETLKHAYRVGWINNEGQWLAMLKDRNLTSHIYNEKTAREIYERIKEHHIELRGVFSAIKNRSFGG